MRAGAAWEHYLDASLVEARTLSEDVPSGDGGRRHPQLVELPTTTTTSPEEACPCLLRGPRSGARGRADRAAGRRRGWRQSGALALGGYSNNASRPSPSAFPSSPSTTARRPSASSGNSASTARVLPRALAFLLRRCLPPCLKRCRQLMKTLPHTFVACLRQILLHLCRCCDRRVLALALGNFLKRCLASALCAAAHRIFVAPVVAAVGSVPSAIYSNDASRPGRAVPFRPRPRNPNAAPPHIASSWRQSRPPSRPRCCTALGNLLKRCLAAVGRCCTALGRAIRQCCAAAHRIFVAPIVKVIRKCCNGAAYALRRCYAAVGAAVDVCCRAIRRIVVKPLVKCCAAICRQIARGCNAVAWAVGKCCTCICRSIGKCCNWVGARR